MQLEVLYEDEAVLVCYKQAGIPTQSAKLGQQDMVSLVATYRKEKGQETYVGLIQRLDQPVEGLIVFGKTAGDTAVLSRQVQEHKVTKEYYAVVRGVPEEKGELTDWLLRDGRTNTSTVVTEGTKGAKKAKLTYERLQVLEDRSLIRVHLYTGRHHQIRVQLAHGGHPLLGDHKYGTADDKKSYLPVGLCSCHVLFYHPVTGKEMEFQVQPKGKAFQGFSF